MPRRVEDFRGLTDLSRLRLVDAIGRAPGRRLAELAEEAGIHINTAREHLKVLEEEGLISSTLLVTGRRGRPPQVFHPVEDAQSNDAAARRAEAAREHGEILRRLDPSADCSSGLDAEASHQIDTLYEHLDDAGLEPAIAEDELRIDLAPCNYRNALQEDRKLVCAVHERLIEQQLAQVPGPVGVKELRPFVEKNRCTLLLDLEGDSAGDA